MILYNKTQEKVITKKLKIAETFFDNLLGFIKEKESDAILFQTRFGLHTLFMKYSIDVIVLDKKNKVVQIKKNLKPNRLFFWNPINPKIIEVSKNKYEVNVGDVLNFE